VVGSSNFPHPQRPPSSFLLIIFLIVLGRDSASGVRAARLQRCWGEPATPMVEARTVEGQVERQPTQFFTPRERGTKPGPRWAHGGARGKGLRRFVTRARAGRGKGPGDIAVGGRASRPSGGTCRKAGGGLELKGDQALSHPRQKTAVRSSKKSVFENGLGAGGGRRRGQRGPHIRLPGAGRAASRHFHGPARSGCAVIVYIRVGVTSFPAGRAG